MNHDSTKAKETKPHSQKGVRWSSWSTLPETNSSHLKMDGWNSTFPLKRPIFRCYVSFREGIYIYLITIYGLHMVTFQWVGVGGLENLDHPAIKPCNLRSDVPLEVRIKGDRINGLFHLLINEPRKKPSYFP